MNTARFRSWLPWCAAAVAAVAAALAVDALTLAVRPATVRPTAVDWAGVRAMRIAAAGHATGAYRMEVAVDGAVASAWIRVACDAGYELVINGDTALRAPLWRPTRAFQNGFSEPGQRMSHDASAIGYNFPREYQWVNHDTRYTPMVADLAPYLRPGRNVFCLDVESREEDPAVVVRGEIRLRDGRRIAIGSGPDWLGEPTAPARAGEDWMARRFTPSGWRRAVDAGPPPAAVTLVPAGAYEAPFLARRCHAALPGASRPVTLTERFTLERAPSAAFLRVLTTSPYAVSVNGRPLRVDSQDKSSYWRGAWDIRDAGREVLDVNPELLDTDEVTSLLPGHAFENPRHGDPTKDSFKVWENTLNRTKERPTGTKAMDVLEGLFAEGDKGRVSDKRWGIERPEAVRPPALAHQRGLTEFSAFGVAALLRPGENTVTLVLRTDEWTGYGRSWRPWAAFDLGVADDSGARVVAATGPRTRVSAPDGATWDGGVLPEEPVSIPDRPPLKFIGNVAPGSPSSELALAFGAVVFVGVGVALRFGARPVRRVVARCARPAAVFGVFLLAAAVLKLAFAERSEALFWRTPWAGPLAVGLALAGAWWVLRRRRAPGASGPVSFRREAVAVTLLLAFCLFVRVWEADRQPLDDDEYASVQAALAIAEKGVPEYRAGVWYTRSPLYHYPAGVVAWLTGGSLYALRCWSALAAVATGALLWWCARLFTGHRAVALGVLALFAVHPFLISTAHIARFYQQQQFFVLLGVFLFVRGVVETADVRWRIACVAAFTAATLSQEITLLHAVPLFLCHAVFARPSTVGDKVRLAVFTAGCVGLVVLDLAYFQLRCLTALDGVSPNVEATLAPRFADPGNVLALGVGYSRLHLFMTPFAVIAVFAALRRRDRVVSFLAMYLVLAVLASNFLVTSSSFRYQYALIPLWLLLCVRGMADLGVALLPGPGRRESRAAFALVLMTVGLVSWSPWRIPGSYRVSLVGDSTGALAYVRAHMRPGDRIGITEPHPHAALIETGRSDYDISVPVLYDFVVNRGGRLVDRNGGAALIGGTGDLQAALRRHERVWLVVNREKFRSRNRNIRWEYPAARTELFLRENTRLVFRSYLWSVFLWDAGEGRWRVFKERPETL